MALIVLAVTWSLAEAIAWFIVADVPLTAIALANPKLAYRAAAWSALAAVVGGAVVYSLAAVHPGTVLTLLERIPAIDGAMVRMIGDDLGHSMLMTLITAGFTGVPYKIVAAQSGAHGVNIALFCGLSFVARLTRYFCTTALAHRVSVYVMRGWPLRRRFSAHASFWLFFYAWYFSVMP